MQLTRRAIAAGRQYQHNDALTCANKDPCRCARGDYITSYAAMQCTCMSTKPAAAEPGRTTFLLVTCGAPDVQQST